jgi:hypothetical protein
LGRLLGAWLVVGSLGCQAVLGDFEIVEPPPAPVGLGATCEPSALRCNGPNLELCAPDRRGWQPLLRCDTAGQCDASAGTCRTCTPGEAACNGAWRQVCNDAGELESVEDCQTPALCRLAGDRSTASCTPPTCNKSSFTCEANRLLECAIGRDHWNLLQRCDSGPLCDAPHAAELVGHGKPATCLLPLCLPGSFACDGANLLRCGNDLNAWVPVGPCADAASCNPRDGSCTPAADGTTACSGRDLVRKSAGGFEKIASCAAPLLCDPEAGECRTSTCGVLGTRRCGFIDEVLPVLEECAADGTWIVREACDHRALCDAVAGRCFAKACDAEAVRCVGPAHQTCSADLSHWETDQTCADGEVCTVDGCEPDACEPNSVRCIAESAQICNVAGRWEPKLHCAKETLCVSTDASCNAPECGGPLGDYSCSPQGETLLRCDPTHAMWNDFRTCMAPTPLCNAERPVGGGIPVCNACEPLAYACNGTALTRCTADGLSNPTIADCPGGCTVSAGVPSCL